jgi:hypothetical protein
MQKELDFFIGGKTAAEDETVELEDSLSKSLRSA